MSSRLLLFSAAFVIAHGQVDVGPPALFSALNGTAFSSSSVSTTDCWSINFYAYSRAEQVCSTVGTAGYQVGVFSGWLVRDGLYTAMNFTGGASCGAPWGARKTTVFVSCAVDVRVSDYTEGPTCSYTATLSTPAACGVMQVSATPSGTASRTTSPSPTPSGTASGTGTLSGTLSGTRTGSVSGTATPSAQGTPSSTRTPSLSVSTLGAGAASPTGTPSAGALSAPAGRSDDGALAPGAAAGATAGGIAAFVLVAAGIAAAQGFRLRVTKRELTRTPREAPREAADATDVTIVSPLSQAGVGAADAKQPGASPTAEQDVVPGWTRCSDDADVWYTGPNGEVSWEPPPRLI